MSRYSGALQAVAVLSLIAVLAVSSMSVIAGGDENVVFNTQSHKFHCATCQSAIHCTKNCITIRKSEAIKRGGVPCKVCGGSCKKAESDSVGATQGAVDLLIGSAVHREVGSGCAS